MASTHLASQLAERLGVPVDSPEIQGWQAHYERSLAEGEARRARFGHIERRPWGGWSGYYLDYPFPAWHVAHYLLDFLPRSRPLSDRLSHPRPDALSDLLVDVGSDDCARITGLLDGTHRFAISVFKTGPLAEYTISVQPKPAPQPRLRQSQRLRARRARPGRRGFRGRRWSEAS